MEIAAVNGPAAAFVAGLVTSLHCVGMCGPLACLLGSRPGERVDVSTIHATYHGARLAGYAVLGAVAGGLAAVPSAWFDAPLVRFLPWVMVAYFFSVALKLGNSLPGIALLGRVQLALRTWVRGKPGVQVAAVMGAATPLIPCGPLYFLVALAGFSGSAVAGTELMLAFGLGTVPLLWLAQANVGWLRARMQPTALGRARTGLALATALVFVWRLRGDLGFSGPGWTDFACH
ncbi:MAG: sulfite exporter TauE/SafE family protein [Verrucomicrobia bacterium]|nr:MAG: sulfite exporter TauE/SafE family protein [Verrucomicrobiota bacterium]